MEFIQTSEFNHLIKGQLPGLGQMELRKIRSAGVKQKAVKMPRA